MNSYKSSVRCSGRLSLILAALWAIMLPGPLAHGQTLPCIETNGVKFLLPPQTDQGFDVKDSRDNIILADDFFCNTAGPITDIHVWGSWLADQHGTITNFWIGIYNDVPAVTNSLNGQITWSHPGTNLLWSQNFGLGQFSETIYTNGNEYFYNPANNTILGGDSFVWYYCFYPTNPFIQQGSANAPTNYWLAIRAQIQDTNTQILYGWKSALVPYNDPAVWGTVLATSGLPLGNWQSMTNPFSQQPLHLSMKLTTPTNTPPPQGCVETNGTKYVQWPNLNQGFDVWDDGPWVLADDFICTNSGPITDIHLWGSWLNDQVQTNTLNFWLAIYDDVPASGNTNSHPGNLLWQEQFAPGQYFDSFWAFGSESFLDPGPPNVMGPDSQVRYYCFYPTNIFIQQGAAAAPKIYWLMVYAQDNAPTYQNYGWKTTTNIQHDVSVYAPWPGSPPIGNPGWTKTQQASTGGPLDLAFKITTATNNTPPPTGCVETNGVKYVQWPNPFGYDVWNSTPFPPGVTDGPWVLADDFICTNTGPITDIHLWGSWLNNQVLTNTVTFWIAMFADVPANPPNVPFSHPGGLIWEQCFAPGQYSESLYGTGQEYFLDPGPPQIVGSDSQIWYYCFYPTNPPIQQGSTSNPKTYWLAVFAQMPTGSQSPFGWKTTTNVQHDISVHAPWPGVFCPTNITGTGFPWTPTFDTFNSPLDLAFKLTTTTNHCIVPIACPVDKNVECGSSWAFDPPTVGSDPCCATPPTVTLTVVTNSNAPCNQKYAGIWTVTDCTGTVLGVCTQNVTVVDTTPPVITCASNKTVQCGTAWNFDNPTALDACCGTNVTINLVSTVTNTPACPLVVTRTWTATDCCTNTSTPCSQTVTVVDTNPPAIICPSNIVVFTCGTNAIVFWTITATDTCSSVTVTSSPPSGTAFLPNTTNTVVATARDACGNTNSCSFTVAVRRPVLGPVFIQYVVTNKVVLTWTNGILMVSTNVLGPYVDVPGATSPYTNTTLPMPPTNRFYRLRCNSP